MRTAMRTAFRRTIMSARFPSKVWEAPDSVGTRYLYVAGLSLDQSNAVLVCEPQHFGEERLVLFADGKVQGLKTAEIHRLMGVEE
jgi:hypothetical protein